MIQTEFELTKENYQYLFENASDAMLVQDITGKIINVNKACEKLTGFTTQELLGKNVKDFLTIESLNVARGIRSRLINAEEITQPYEQQLVRKDGAIATIMMATSLITTNGEAIGFQHIARDITEEKRAEEMLSKITDGSPIPTFVVDKQHKVTYWNTSIESLSGVSRQEIVGTDEQWRAFYAEKRPVMVDLIVDGASADEIEAYYFGKCKKSSLIDGAYEAEDFFPALGEHGKWLHFTASPIKNEGGEVIGAIETLQDVTEGKQLQENMRFYVQLTTQAQEDERKRVARELHDDVSSSLLLLTQRLDTITSSNRLTQSRALKEELETLRSQAVEALEQLRRCAQDLRPPILDDLGLVSALEWMADNIEENYGIKAHVEVIGAGQDMPVEVQLLLFRIAQEALSNIRRHAKASTATVKLDFGDDNIIMTVSDNGKGFEVPQIVEDLASTKRLGIIGMYERIGLLGGTLEIKSAIGKGTHVVAKVLL